MTVTAFTDNETAVGGIGSNVVVKEAYLDFSSTGASANEVVQAIKVGAGDVVLDVRTEVVTVEATSGTIVLNVGDGSDANGFDADVDLTSAAISTTIKGTDAYAVGKRYTAADTIDVESNAALDAAVIRLIAVIAKAEKSASSDNR